MGMKEGMMGEMAWKRYFEWWSERSERDHDEKVARLQIVEIKNLNDQGYYMFRRIKISLGAKHVNE